MTPLVFRYNLDPTGVDPDNLVQGEIHVMENRRVRAIAPKHGAFFAQSLIVTDTVTGIPLVKGTQYYAAELYEMPSGRYGKEIDAIVLIVDPNVSNSVTLKYQALGGEYSMSAEAMINMINNLNLDGRPVAWGNIIGKPDEFNPARHLHDLGDTYGWEYVCHAINRVEQAILIGDIASHDSIYQYIDTANAATAANFVTLTSALNAHTGNVNNPHATTAAQVGAYTKGQVDTKFTASNLMVNDHINDDQNPHNVTALQLGVYTKVQSDVMFDTRDDALTAHVQNTLNPHNVTAAQLSVYTKAQADVTATTLSNAITTHATATNNPHATTAAQVGAYTKTEADAITSPISTAVTTHANRTDNPHATTADQVGAYTKGQVDAFNAAMTNGINGVSGALSTLINAPDPFPQYLTPAEATAAYVKQGGGVGQSTNQVFIGWSGVGKLKATVDVTDLGNIALESYVDGRIDALGTNLVARTPNIPAVKSAEAIYVAGIGMMDWVVTGYYSGYRSIECGQPMMSATTNARACELDLDGRLVSKAAYPSLWAWAQENGLSTSEAGWQASPGCYYFASYDATWFRLPDMRDKFFRAAGAVRSRATFQDYAMQQHNHAADTSNDPGHFHGSGWGESYDGSRHGIYTYDRGQGSNSTDNNNYEVKTTTNGAHTHSVTISTVGDVETRPENTAFVARVHI